MALKDEWRSQREQRQTEARWRKEAVQTQIKTLNDQRQAATAQLQNQLRQFRTTLAQAEADRRFQGQQQQIALQTYTQNLQDWIEDFLETCTTERSLMSDRIATTLQETLERLQTETRNLLQTARQSRQQRYGDLQEDLAEFIEDLHLQMDSYRQHLEQKRQERIAEIQTRKTEVKKTLQENRQQQQESYQVLQGELDRFIQSLQAYRQNLYQAVWGDTPVAVPAQAVKPKPIFRSKRSISIAKGAVPKPAVSLPQPIPITPSLTPPPTPEQVLQKADKKNVNYLSTEEEQVYNFLRKTPASRLTAIEEALGINRVQAVDTLRSLIKKGMVTQRDRLYSVL
ncbi:MAG: hypothetical protein J7545_20695 [Roseofilum sp. SBFL]|uniref:hypothetical protein n=1 Tax=unclassified Roseofilum TaxID=2620099 RepID=UPI001B272A3C|nr:MULTISPECIES: hypothetical protein [unclassified Roseofilum]MBP0012795.1 hypothetical protein [Roseofilum sp. SID3]MBP0025173.1 hypothetical protein [Roseofilum sp. SID2]MBP0039788.1 hypothetical protein [Roseofilum sp. SID1]MBP0044361.1 hypothetical protein [Roseofilum sp. SBFL]